MILLNARSMRRVSVKPIKNTSSSCQHEQRSRHWGCVTSRACQILSRSASFSILPNPRTGSHSSPPPSPSSLLPHFRQPSSSKSPASSKILTTILHHFQSTKSPLNPKNLLFKGLHQLQSRRSQVTFAKGPRLPKKQASGPKTKKPHIQVVGPDPDQVTSFFRETQDLSRKVNDRMQHTKEELIHTLSDPSRASSLSMEGLENLFKLGHELFGMPTDNLVPDAPKDLDSNEPVYSKQRHFVDMKISQCLAGSGGKGAASFFRGPNQRRGPPDGGNGGNGGNVVLVVSEGMPNLAHLKHQYHAASGKNGNRNNCHGKNGQDIEIEVPIGTIVWKYVKPVPAEPKKTPAASQSKIQKSVPHNNPSSSLAPNKPRANISTSNFTPSPTSPNPTSTSPNSTPPNLTSNSTSPNLTPNSTSPNLTPNSTSPNLTSNSTPPNLTSNSTSPNLTPNSTSPNLTSNSTPRNSTSSAPQSESQNDHPPLNQPQKRSILSATREMIVDLNRANQRYVLARGGTGGKGNAFFASPKNRSPKEFEEGTPGEERHVLFELKSIADVGLVGFPNAGKSSLLKGISNALPKIANYPFTTINPYIGTIDYPDFTQVKVADMPGLIEGAHEGHGLGIEFLRHIERTKILCFIVDVGSPRGMFGGLTGTPISDYEILVKELEMYDKSLLNRPCVILGNKIDLGPAAKQSFTEFANRVDPYQQKIVVPISAKDGTNIAVLKDVFKKLVDAVQRQKPEEFLH